MNAPLLRNVTPARAPLYQQVAQSLAKALSEGRFAPGQALPNERVLANEFGVSIGTLRAAVDGMVNTGALVRQQGRGTFVAKHDRDRLRFYFFHVTAHDQPKGAYPDVRFDSFSSTKADETVALRLQIRAGDRVFKIRNVLWIDGQPVMVDEIYLCAAKFPRLSESMVRNRESTLYHLYQSRFERTVSKTSERLRACAAPGDCAALLQLKRAAPVLQIRRVAYAYDGSPVEWRVSHVNTDAHEYVSELGS